MDRKPVLVIMAAGMGSRYGGLKQMDAVGPAGEVIIDYSLYDARRAGFETAVCVISRRIEKDFKAIMDRGAARRMNILYAFQEITDVPEGFSVPEGRSKPWGTGHAVLSARDLVDAPFAVINADDYYGPGAFRAVYDFLASAEDAEVSEFCMAGYKIENTLTENGSVSRGICVEENGYLKRIDERKRIEKRGETIQYTEDGGESWMTVDPGTLVSMNFFGYTRSFMDALSEKFPARLEEILREDPLRGEYYVPAVTGDLINEGRARVKVLPAADRWIGVTYKEDRPQVTAAMREKTKSGLYPEDLWG